LQQAAMHVAGGKGSMQQASQAKARSGGRYSIGMGRSAGSEEGMAGVWRRAKKGICMCEGEGHGKGVQQTRKYTLPRSMALYGGAHKENSSGTGA